MNFPPKVLQIFYGIASFASGYINHEYQNAATCDVAQEFVAQPNPPVCSFDQTRDIRNGRPPVTWHFHYTDDRMQRRERICCDLRPRSRDFPQKCRFACIRITNESC